MTATTVTEALETLGGLCDPARGYAALKGIDKAVAASRMIDGLRRIDAVLATAKTGDALSRSMADVLGPEIRRALAVYGGRGDAKELATRVPDLGRKAFGVLSTTATLHGISQDRSGSIERGARAGIDIVLKSLNTESIRRLTGYDLRTGIDIDRAPAHPRGIDRRGGRIDL